MTRRAAPGDRRPGDRAVWVERLGEARDAPRHAGAQIDVWPDLVVGPAQRPEPRAEVKGVLDVRGAEERGGEIAGQRNRWLESPIEMLSKSLRHRGRRSAIGDIAVGLIEGEQGVTLHRKPRGFISHFTRYHQSLGRQRRRGWPAADPWQPNVDPLGAQRRWEQEHRGQSTNASTHDGLRWTKGRR